jgi:streptogramin lyase
MDQIHGVTFDGTNVWFARGESLVALDPTSGTLLRELPVAAEAGTAFDGQYLWQLADAHIQKIDPRSGQIVATIPAPAEGRDSGLTWAEGSLWVGEYRARKIHQIEPKTGAILRTIESDRFVTGVSWVQGELWHGAMEAEQGELRRVDPKTGEVLERFAMPAGLTVSGLEGDGAGVFYCGGGSSGKLRAVRKPKR